MFEFKRMAAVGLLVLGLTACATVNEGLDGANEGAKQVGKPIGKTMNIPSSAMEGAAEGIATEEKEDNPLGR